jgi:D-glutamate cyclase
MSEPALDTIRDLIQEDVGNRGLRADPRANLITACPGDLGAACRSIVEAPLAVVGVVTGFYIPHAKPPRGETDGPLGALFLARALNPLGAKVVLATDGFCTRPLMAGLEACGLIDEVPLITLPPLEGGAKPSPQNYTRGFLDQVHERVGPLTHLIALERAGPSHTRASLGSQPGSTSTDLERFLREMPALEHDRYHTMSGRDVTAHMSPAHWLFEEAPKVLPIKTIGIGDGGNEIGMGKIPWDIIRRNIPGGGLIACRVGTDYLVVSGVSNWGAYGLAAAAYSVAGIKPDADLFDAEREQELLRIMVEHGPLVDGVTGEPSATVDGLPFDRYAQPLRRLGAILAS